MSHDTKEEFCSPQQAPHRSSVGRAWDCRWSQSEFLRSLVRFQSVRLAFSFCYFFLLLCFLSVFLLEAFRSVCSCFTQEMRALLLMTRRLLSSTRAAAHAATQTAAATSTSIRPQLNFKGWKADLEKHRQNIANRNVNADIDATVRCV